jgi:hypothetical protein
MTIATTFILVLLYSPVSQYFGGWTIDRFDGVDAQEKCAKAAGEYIGHELQTTMVWETEMMGPKPKVIVAFCAQGEAAK